MKPIVFLLGMILALPAFASDPSANCFNNLDNEVSFLPLRKLIALGNIKNQNLDMLTNTGYPSAQEKELIKAWVKERDRCFVLGEIWRVENMPANMRSILDDYYARNKLLIADLYISKINYGEFASKRAALSSALNASLNEAWRANQTGQSAGSAIQSQEEKEHALSRAAMLEAATKIFDGNASQSAGTSTQVTCAGGKSSGDQAVNCK